MRISLTLAALLLPLPAFAQEGTLDVLDGETLYEDGWLLTLSTGLEKKEGLLKGRRHASDPLDRTQEDTSLIASAHYGLRYNVQLSAIVPFVRRELELDDPVGPDRLAAEGFGDASLIGKWRFYRWDAPGVAFNTALIAGMELPTGDGDARDHGVALPPDLQPGSGSWDPFLGIAATHEPERWRFNAFALFKLNGQGEDDYSQGEEFFAELAAGNRFWLEPYPGPFMRLDMMLRYRHEGRDRAGGSSVSDSGGDSVTLGLNWAFRPRPSLDFQLSIEIPAWQSLNGTQLEEDYTVFFTFGYRL